MTTPPARDRKDQPLFPNPDFEMYDNTGRAAEQIHAHHTNTPTTDDLRRRAADEARPLLDAARLPPSGDGITPWTDLLGRASNAHEVYTVITAVLADDRGALARLHQFIESAANWYDERGDEPAKRRYRGRADDLDALSDDLVQLAEDNLLTARRQRSEPARQPPASPRPGTPAAPPAPLSTPRPSRR